MGRFQGGRGFGGRGGRGGRGGGYRSNKSNQKNDKKKQANNDLKFHLGSANHANEYQSTMEHWINHIRENYEYGDDMATALEEEKEYDVNKDKPVLVMETDATEAELEQAKMEFKIDYEVWRDRVKTYKNNKSKAYALLLKHSAKRNEEQDRGSPGFREQG